MLDLKTYEITKLCFEYLQTPDLLRVSMVSRGFAEVATGPDFWHYPSSQSTGYQGSQ